MRNFIVIFIVFIFFSCEDEDICVEGSTPRLVIENIHTKTDTITVDSLKIYRLEAENKTLVYLQNSGLIHSFKIPLNLEESQSTLFAIKTYIGDKDYDDQLKVNYNYNLNYVSKACGFRVNYDSIQASLTPDFFKTVEVLNNSLDNEASAHLRLSY